MMKNYRGNYVRILLAVLLCCCAAGARVGVTLVQDPGSDRTSTFFVDEEGRLFIGGETTWEPASDGPCPAAAPYDISGLLDTGNDRVLVFMIAGDGACFIVGPGDWIELDPLEGLPPYRLACCPDLTGENAMLIAVDAAGQVWLYTAEGWRPFLEPVPGPGPYDINAFSELERESIFLDVVNGAGRLFRVMEDGWYALEVELDGDPPFSVSSYNSDDAAYHFVTDSTGSFWMLEDGSVINTISALLDGRGPYDMDVYVRPDEEFMAVVLCDSDGVIYNTDGESWLAQNEGFSDE